MGPLIEYLYLKIQDLSSLTNYENIRLTATMYYYNEDKFKCDDKLKEYAKREGPEKAKKRLERENGCGIYRAEPRYEIDSICFHECVCGFRDNRLGFYLDVLNKLENGVMPFKGSYLDQPSKMIEILNRIGYIKNDMEIRALKEKNKNV